ncbi:MAG: hypothetical protein HS117_25740 [Verrucomicrobiaceae bacterium]|jgi:hypothetical protein|nr:hypothetical protein [Verrucomicrobiaceae bacterium]
MALFFPAITPTRRRRSRRYIPLTVVVGVVSTVAAVWMISQVYLLHKQRHEDRLEEMFSPRKPSPGSTPSRPNPPVTQPEEPAAMLTSKR